MFVYSNAKNSKIKENKIINKTNSGEYTVYSENSIFLSIYLFVILIIILFFYYKNMP